MLTMKIVVNRNRNTRTVINTDFEQQSIVVDRHLRRRSYAAANFAGRENRNLKKQINKLIARRKRSATQERNARYRMKMRVRRDIAITREQFARLSVNYSTDNLKAERKKNNVQRSVIQLREPVLQFSRNYEDASSSIASAASSISIEKTDLLSDSIISTFKCRMCPNYAVPEIYDCSSGHLVCHECYLISSYCTLCFDENTKYNESSSFRRIVSLEKIASLLMFPCRWRMRGCLESFDSATWRNHVDTCEHAEVQLNALASASQVSSSDLSDYEIDSEENVVDPQF